MQTSDVPSRRSPPPPEREADGLAARSLGDRPPPPEREADGLAARSLGDRVTHSLRGMFISADSKGGASDGEVFETEDFDAYEIGARSASRPAIGERVVVYVDCLGAVNGEVVGHTDRGFRLSIEISDTKRATLRKLIAIMQARLAAGQPIGRRHERIVPISSRVDVVDFEGLTHPAEIIDVSRSGVALSVEGLQIGDVICIGERTQGQVVRLIEGGVGVQFQRVIPIEEFDERVRL